MTIGRRKRAENQRVAFVLMLSTLGDDAIDTTLFDSEASPFAESVQRTTWEDLVRAHYVSRIVATTYRLTAKGLARRAQTVGCGGIQFIPRARE